MRFTIGKKLGLGFGVVIGLMVVSAMIAHVNLRRIDRAAEIAVYDAVPTSHACDQLLNGVNESLAALRGFVILGDDPEQARFFHDERSAAWRSIDAALAELDGRITRWNHPELNDQLTRLHRACEEFRDTQQSIELTVHAEGNIVSQDLLSTEGSPRADELLALLTAMIDEEKVQPASVDRRALLAALADSRGFLAQGWAHIRAYLVSGEGELKQEFLQSWQVHQQAYDRVRSHEALFTPAQQQLWQQFVAVRSEFASLPTRLFDLREAEDWNKAQYLLETEAVPRATILKDALHRIASHAETREQTSVDEMRAASGTMMASLWGATVICVITGSLIAFTLGRRIVTIMRALAERASAISKGNLTASALLIKSGDELGQLANGFDVMLGNLKDLTRQILAVTENVNSATSQISSSAQQQATSCKEQASTVQEITSTMQEIAQTGSQIIDKARDVSTAAELVAQQSRSGIDAVQGTSHTMESIREQVEEVAENIVALSEKTQAVGEIISTVNDIAEQSNLLALNATIEAAAAGDEGNRFSVVANEIKNLADQAKDCTVQVRNILGDIQKGITSAVMLTEEAVKRVESGKEKARISEDAIRRMSESTDESVQAFQQILGATNQQQIGFEQVTRGMREIDQVTQQTAAGTAQLEQAVVSLSALSQQLKSAVCNYKIQA